VKKKGKRFERNGRKAPGLKLQSAMTAEPLFELRFAYLESSPFLGEPTLFFY